MIKLVLWCARRHGITAAELFQSNHRVHGDLVRSGPVDFQAQILRYTQSYAFDGAHASASRQPFDAISELWYESPESLQENLAHPYYSDVIVPDGANYADLSTSVVHLAAEELVEAPLRGQGIKVVRWLQAPEGIDSAAFDDFWIGVHHAESKELTGLLGYARNRLPSGAPSIAGTPPTAYDAMWLDSTEDLPAFRRYARRVLDAGQHAGMLDMTGCHYMLCQERRVRDTLDAGA